MAQAIEATENISKSESPDQCKMQGHWLLAKMGKRVLRPGGLELTKQMLDLLNVQRADRVVEFAPGLGVTARLVLSKNPAEYTAIEADAAAAAKVKGYLSGSSRKCIIGSAEHTGLLEASAVLSMERQC